MLKVNFHERLERQKSGFMHMFQNILMAVTYACLDADLEALYVWMFLSINLHIHPCLNARDPVNVKPSGAIITCSPNTKSPYVYV